MLLKSYIGWIEKEVYFSMKKKVIYCSYNWFAKATHVYLFRIEVIYCSYNWFIKVKNEPFFFLSSFWIGHIIHQLHFFFLFSFKKELTIFSTNLEFVFWKRKKKEGNLESNYVAKLNTNKLTTNNFIRW